MLLLRLVRMSLVLTVAVIILGAFTRLEHAGLGCPDWPGCYGSWTVPTEPHQVALAEALYPELTIVADKAWLEMIHRYFAGGLGLLVFAISTVTLARHKQWSGLAVALSSLVIFQAMLGMWTVTMKLMPLVVMGHLLGGFTLFSLLCLFYWRMQDSRGLTTHRALEADFKVPLKLRILVCVSFVAVVIQIALGGWTSSNYAALMCTELPVCEGEWQGHLAFKEAFTLIQPARETYEFGTLDYGPRMTIHVVHRFGALVVFWCVLATCYQLIKTPHRQLHNIAYLALGLLCLQIALGISNVLYSLPLVIAILHNVVASFLLVTCLRALMLVGVKVPEWTWVRRESV